MFAEFEDAGTIHALKRICNLIDKEYDLPALPTWIFASRIDHIIGSEFESGYSGGQKICSEAKEVILALSVLEKAILNKGEYTTQPESCLEQRSDVEKVHLVALARLLLGACCEAYIIKKCNRMSPCGEYPKSALKSIKVARVYKDSCHAACWTSAHALYIHDLLERGLSAAHPSLHSTLNEFNEPELSHIYAHRLSPSIKGSCANLVSLLSKCTNTGPRGWDSTLTEIINGSLPIRKVCSNALSVSITGLHACLHPSRRPHWKDRLSLSLHMKDQTLVEWVKILCSNKMAFKELMRRFVSNTVASDFATVHALKQSQHPLCVLIGSCGELRPYELELSAMAFVDVGMKIVQSRGTLSFKDAMQEYLRFPLNGEASQIQVRANRNSYLGRGTPCVQSKVSAVSIASEIWSTAFKCNFVPFWAHSSCHNMRACRLDKAQHAAIHDLNSATTLTNLLPKREQLHLQRLALSQPTSALMTLSEVGKLLGLERVCGTTSNAGTKNVLDSLNAISTHGPHAAAQILHFCRAASMSDHIMIYDLNERTKQFQKNAVIKRSSICEREGVETMTDDQRFAMVPEHMKNLIVCIECKRVANAVVDDGGESWKSSFNEIGTRSSMLYKCTETNICRLRCAKRSSTSLKSSLAREGQMAEAKVDVLEIEKNDIQSAFDVNTNTTSGQGVAARAKRDSKVSFEQKECSEICGTTAMVSIPIAGKAVKLWNGLFTMCHLCGCLLKMSPNNIFGADPCCLRCDSEMLNHGIKQTITRATSTQACRYCGKVRYITCITLLSCMLCCFLKQLLTCVFVGRPEKSWC